MLKVILLLACSLCILEKSNGQTIQTSETKPKVDSLANQNDSTVELDKRVFTKVQNEAEFRGGIYAWTRYLEYNLNANVPIKNGAPDGVYQVIVKFIVAKDGSINKIIAETNHGYGMEQEVIRIIEKGPKWTPAKQNGRPVNAYRRQPVNFVISKY